MHYHKLHTTPLLILHTILAIDLINSSHHAGWAVLSKHSVGKGTVASIAGVPSSLCKTDIHTPTCDHNTFYLQNAISIIYQHSNILMLFTQPCEHEQGHLTNT